MYTYKINQIDDKVKIEIHHRGKLQREFDIEVSKDGLVIIGSDSLVVRPMSSTRVEIDTV